MTPEERAKGVVGDVHRQDAIIHDWQTCPTCAVEHEVAKRIKEAESEEQERCAKIVETYPEWDEDPHPDYGDSDFDAIAKKIRGS